jgi:hypothetical protein
MPEFVVHGCVATSDDERGTLRREALLDMGTQWGAWPVCSGEILWFSFVQFWQDIEPPCGSGGGLKGRHRSASRGIEPRRSVQALRLITTSQH